MYKLLIMQGLVKSNVTTPWQFERNQLA